MAESEKDSKQEGDKPSSEDSKPDSKGEAKPERKQSPTARGQQKRREEKLAMIKQQVEDGTLTIRQMTPEERKANPPVPRKSKKRR